MEVSQLTEFSDQVIKAVELASNEVMDIYNSESFIVEDKSDGSPVTTVSYTHLTLPTKA